MTCSMVTLKMDSSEWGLGGSRPSVTQRGGGTFIHDMLNGYLKDGQF